jgi:hypothetical protein
MYYEEKLVNGVLCWRNTPNGEWNAFDVREMTRKYLVLKDEHDNIKWQLDGLRK